LFARGDTAIVLSADATHGVTNVEFDGDGTTLRGIERIAPTRS